jgi:hypothetical protein
MGAYSEEHREYSMPNKPSTSRNGRRSSLRITPQKTEANGNGTHPIRLATEEEAVSKGHIEYFTNLADIALGLKRSRSN